MALHGDGTDGGQEREDTVLNLRNRHLTSAIGHGNQIGITPVGLITDEAISHTVRGKHQRMPSLEERNMDGIAFKTVGHIRCGIAFCVLRAEDQGIVAGDTEDLGIGTLNSRVFEIGEALLPIKNLDSIVIIPVAADDDPSIVQLQAGRRCMLPFHAAKAIERMGLGVVEFGQIGLSDADGLFAASEEQHLARLHHDGASEVVGIDHIHHMPLAILQVFGCGSGHKAVGMATGHHQFAIDEKRRMA